jgi:hypothetical protein
MLTAPHESRFALKRLEQLQRPSVVPTLGEISRALKSDLWKARHDLRRAEIAAQYDEVFGIQRSGIVARPDYSLWRREFGRKYPTEISNSFPATEILLRAGLSSHEPVVVWGILSMAHGLGTSERGDQLRVDGSHEALAHEIEQAVSHRRLAPLSNAYAGCALHRLLALGAIDKIRFEANPTGTIPLHQLTDYLNTVERLIGEIDSSWWPGRSVSLEALEGERPIGTLGIFDLKLRIDETLFRVRGCVRHELRTQSLADPQAQALIVRAMQFAFSSWRCARSSRLFIAKLARQGRSRFQMAVSEEKELRALVRASQSAKDAGQFSLAAKLCFWALRTMPNSLLEKQEFAALGNQLGHDIRQFGYEPDIRFSRQKRSRFALPLVSEAITSSGIKDDANGEAGQTANNQQSDSVTSEDNGPVVETTASQFEGKRLPQSSRRGRLIVGNLTGYDSFKAQILADQQSSEDWRTVLKTYPCNPANPLDSIGRVVYDATRIEDEALLRAAFQLSAFKYRLPAPSAQLIQHFQPTKDDVVKLAALFEHVTRAMPIGMNDEVLREWQDVLRKAWQKVPVSERIYEEELLSFHEVLLGRGVAVLRASEHATEYAQQFFGDRGDDEIRHLLDSDLSLLHNVKTRSMGSKLKMQFQEFVTTSMPEVVWVSLVSLTPSEWSVLMVGDKGRWHCDRLTFDSSILDEGKRLSDMKGWGESWFQVPWRSASGLWKLAQTIGEVVVTNYPTARYLHLAVEPRLARLPWNDLFRPIWKAQGMSPVIAIIPNFTWALVANRMDHERKVLLVAANEDALVGNAATGDEVAARLFCTAREQLLTSRSLLKQIYSSAAFVLARGAWNSDAKMAELEAPEGTIALKHEKNTDLLDLGKYRIVIAYACRAGHVAQHFLGDLGGIPGVCLSLRTRLLLGPVAEVSPTTVAVLHKHLADPKGPREIGFRYLQALREDRSVAHFNLFGFANESV